jgi:hypothetical protein
VAETSSVPTLADVQNLLGKNKVSFYLNSFQRFISSILYSMLFLKDAYYHEAEKKQPVAKLPGSI